jgi:preprotein translocase SecE subunit
MMADMTAGERIYAIGDIHGRSDLLGAMLARIDEDLAARAHPRPRLVFLGDYVDRGPDSRGVIDTLVGLEAGPVATSFLLGNHDACALAFLDDPEWFDQRRRISAPACRHPRGVAQLVEHRSPKPRVVGSSPIAPASMRTARGAAMARTNPFQFMQQVRAEVAKVVWPTRRETGMTTIMVMLMATLFAIFFFLVDLDDPLLARDDPALRLLNPSLRG